MPVVGPPTGGRRVARKHGGGNVVANLVAKRARKDCGDGESITAPIRIGGKTVHGA